MSGLPSPWAERVSAVSLRAARVRTSDFDQIQDQGLREGVGMASCLLARRVARQQSQTQLPRMRIRVDDAVHA